MCCTKCISSTQRLTTVHFKNDEKSTLWIVLRKDFSVEKFTETGKLIFILVKYITSLLLQSRLKKLNYLSTSPWWCPPHHHRWVLNFFFLSYHWKPFLCSHAVKVNVKEKADIALPVGNPTSELRDVTCHMESHSVTCYPTQVNAHKWTRPA